MGIKYLDDQQSTIKYIDEPQGAQQGAPEQKRGVVGDAFHKVSTVPSAAARSAIMGKGYTKGALNPEDVPTFQDTALDLYYNKADSLSHNAIANEILNIPSPIGFTMKELGGFVASAGGLSADILTNPADMLLMLAGKAPAGGGKTLGGKALATKPGQALVKFMTTPVDEMMKNAFQRIPMPKTLKNLKSPTDFYRSVRASLFEKRAAAGKQFGARLDSLTEQNPNKLINIDETINNIRPQLDPKSDLYNPRLRQQLNSAAKKQANTVLTDIIDGKKATDITLKEAQAIKKTIDRAPSIASKLKKGKFADYDDTDIDLLEIKNDVDRAALEVFDEFQNVKAEFGEVADKFKTVKNKFSKGNLESNVKKKFGSGEIWEDVVNLLPEHIIKQIGNHSAAINILKATGTIAGTGLAFSLAHQLITRPITRALTGQDN